MKQINFSEKEVAKEYKNSKFIKLVGKPTFRRLTCLKSWGAWSENDEPLFRQGQSYDIWICNVYKNKQGTFEHYVAIPRIIADEDKNNRRFIIPQEVFGKITDREEEIVTRVEAAPRLVVKDEHLEEMETEIGSEKFKLVADFNNNFLLIPSWRLNKVDVEAYIIAEDCRTFECQDGSRKKAGNAWLKLYPALPQKYVLIPRILGTSAQNMFIAWEIQRKMNKKVTLASYFNIFNGREAFNWQDLDIRYPVGNNQKQAQIKRLYVRYSRKKINVSFKRL